MTTELVGVREIAELLRLRRQRADQLSRTKGFPEPVAELASGRIWRTSDVVDWANTARPVQEVVREELRHVPQGHQADGMSIYRMTYAVVRQKGLGRKPEGVEPTPAYAHNVALATARKYEPDFYVPSPATANASPA